MKDMERLNKKKEYYQKLRDDFAKKANDLRDSADYYYLLTLVGASQFKVCVLDTKVLFVSAIRSFADHRLYRINEKQKRLQK